MARSLNDIATDIFKLQLKRKGLELKVKDCEVKEEKFKLELQKLADTTKLTFGGDKKLAWEIKPSTVPQATNWDEFYEYLHKNRYYHLLQRRPAVLACQELWGQGKVIPGIEKFTKMKVTVKEA